MDDAQPTSREGKGSILRHGAIIDYPFYYYRL